MTRSSRWAARCCQAPVLCSCILACSQEPAPPPPPVPIEVTVTGHEFEWYHSVPDPAGDSTRVVVQRDLHLPVGCEVTLALHSKDYIYTLALPEFGIKEIAVPDLRFELKFVADRIGTFQLKGDQMCGYQHENLIGKLVIQPRPQFMAWLAEKGAKDDAEDLQDLGLLRADRPDEPLLVR